MSTTKINSLNYALGDKQKKEKISVNNIIEDKIKKKNIFLDKNHINLYGNENDYSHKKLNSNELDSNKLDSNELDSNEYIENEYIDNEYIELEKLEKEFTIKSGYNSLSHPKNYGNIWNDDERNKIKKYLLKNKFNKNYGMFDESNIFDIAKKLERSEYGVKEEIKKMIYNDYIKGYSYDKISENFNIPVSNVKLIIKLFIEKYGKKIINQIEVENKLLRLKVENIRLKKELEELNK